jgi:hypothetical protein
MIELTYTPEQVRQSLRESLIRHTVPVRGLPEGDAELPDECLPEDLDDDDEEEEDE